MLEPREVLADIGDVHDPEVWRIIGVDHYEDPRQKTQRLARSGKIPGYQPWKCDKFIFFKSELRKWAEMAKG